MKEVKETLIERLNVEYEAAKDAVREAKRWDDREDIDFARGSAQAYRYAIDIVKEVLK